MYIRALFSSTSITTIVIRRFTMLCGIILSSHCNHPVFSWWQALSQAQSFSDFVETFHSTEHVKMLWENGSVSQHRFFSFTINFLPTINPCTNNQIRHALKKCAFLMSLCLTIFQKDFKSIPEVTHISLCYWILSRWI